MPKRRQAQRVRREFTPAEHKHWEQAVRAADSQREAIVHEGRIIFAAHRLAKDLLLTLRKERIRQNVSLADMMERTGMSRAALCRLENDESPNPTMLTFARYAAALGVELQFSTSSKNR